MDWTRQVDGYCERMGPEYWAEPINAVTNLAFILAAILMWRRSADVQMARALCAVLFAIGVGSYLFHTHAQVWAGLADVAPIAGFVLLYLFAFNRDVLNFSWYVALPVAFFALAASSVLVSNLGWLMQLLGSSGPYAAVLLLIVAYAVVVLGKSRETALNLLLAAALFSVSLTFRTVDEVLCAGWPMGTHFMWHVLNGLLLGWMIELYLRARLGKPSTAL